MKREKREEGYGKVVKYNGMYIVIPLFVYIKRSV